MCIYFSSCCLSHFILLAGDLVLERVFALVGAAPRGQQVCLRVSVACLAPCVLHLLANRCNQGVPSTRHYIKVQPDHHVYHFTESPECSRVYGPKSSMVYHVYHSKPECTDHVYDFTQTASIYAGGCVKGCPHTAVLWFRL